MRLGQPRGDPRELRAERRLGGDAEVRELLRDERRDVRRLGGVASRREPPRACHVGHATIR